MSHPSIPDCPTRPRAVLTERTGPAGRHRVSRPAGSFRQDNARAAPEETGRGEVFGAGTTRQGARLWHPARE